MTFEPVCFHCYKCLSEWHTSQFFTTWWQQRAHLTLVFPLSFSLPCVFRGRWKPAGYGRCCRTSTRLLWAPARLLSFAPRQAVWAAWNPGHFPPWHMATMLGWLLWGRWCSAWPLRVAWPCKRILFNSNGPLMHVQLDSGCKCKILQSSFLFFLQYVWHGGQWGDLYSGDGLQHSR